MKRFMIIGLFIVVALTSAFSAGNITIKGSDTLVRLGQRWAEIYMKTHPGTILQVSGGGTGTGIAALLNGTTDVCQASRDMKKKEYSLAESKGIKPFRVAVALDGIAVFLHKDNPIKEFSIPQLRAIYTGQVTNWKELGGPDKRIILYSRENNSGTYEFFKEHVLDGDDYAPETQNLPGTASVVNAVAKDPFGIGYGGIAWETNVKHAWVKANDTATAVEPTVDNVKSGAYPISRELYWFFNGQPTGQVKELVNWVLSEEGQKIAVEADYVPLSKEAAAKNLLQ